jgi:hypothetical protein
LILDLGRPERFLNMLRVFRPTSVLNMGSWVLALAGPAAGLAAVTARTGGPAGRLGDLSGVAAGLLGLPLAGYPAVLLADTAVPLWQETRRSLPWLFVASSAEGAASLLELTAKSPRERRIASRFGSAARLAHLGSAALVAKDAGRTERVGRPLKNGLSGTLWRLSTAGTAAALLLAASKASRRKTRVGSAVGAAAGLSLRFAVFHAGKASAADPRATTEPQRARRVEG